MKTLIKRLLVITTIAGGMTAGLVYAMPPRDDGEGCQHGGRTMGFGHPGMGPEARIDRMAEALDLTKEQRAKVRAIVDKARPQTRELRDQLSDKRKELHALMQQEAPKDRDIRKIADDQGKLIADLIVQRTKVKSEIRAVLTPEQREKLQQRFEHRGRLSSVEPDEEPASMSDGGSSDEQRSALRPVSM